MTFWLVTATPRPALLGELEVALRERRFERLRPFGRALSAGLAGARRKGGQACWEEEDYCDPPLAEERTAVLDRYFTSIEVRAVEEGQGWRQLAALPRLFPGLSR
ncbi:hypothetical protein SH611_16585 [Geminicoccaceae bacterium 1502E]|nr:hypothetical protein [Geminicoccaceae bacterium 1502E]